MPDVKKVKSVTDLRQLALINGARVVLDDGTVFNSQGLKKVPKPVNSDEIAAALRLLAQQLGVQNQSVIDALSKIKIEQPAMTFSPKVTVPEASPVEWRFKITRDRDGNLKEIVATPED